jgi:hypothetical protein
LGWLGEKIGYLNLTNPMGESLLLDKQLFH